MDQYLDDAAGADVTQILADALVNSLEPRAVGAAVQGDVTGLDAVGSNGRGRELSNHLRAQRLGVCNPVDFQRQ